jgi:hypothetical protein
MKKYKVYQNGSLIGKDLSYQEAAELSRGLYNSRIVEEMTTEEYMESKMTTAFRHKLEWEEHSRQCRAERGQDKVSIIDKLIIGTDNM